MTTFDHLTLIPFQTSHATEVVRWAASAEEARQWAGPGVQWPLKASVFQAWYADPEVQPYTLCQGEILLGYGEVWTDAEKQEVELARIIIRPASRGRGVGQRLVALLLERAALTGYPCAFLRVFPENHVAIDCYMRAGFSPVSAEEQRDYNRGQPVEYLWLRKELDKPDL